MSYNLDKDYTVLLMVQPLPFTGIWQLDKRLDSKIFHMNGIDQHSAQITA